MVWHLFPGKFGDEASFLPRLRRLADIARAVLVLEEPPARKLDDLVDPGDEGDLSEVGCFSLCPSIVFVVVEQYVQHLKPGVLPRTSNEDVAPQG